MAEEDKFDVAVIGGGPAGMMAAIIASESGANVVLIEKNKQLGKKLLLTGNGRCNITNAEFNLKELVANYGKGGEFLFHAFSVFGPKETIKFFEKLGVKTKIEADKRVFPASDDAEEVLEALNKYLAKNKVVISLDSKVSEIILKGSRVEKIIVGDPSNPSGQVKKIVARKYIFCIGGKSYSLTGSDGLGYELVEKLGHAIVRPMPALAPIKIKEEWAKKLQGISLKDVKISVFSRLSGIPLLAGQNGLPAQAWKKQFSEEGEILFTHFGISGPAVLNISGRVGDLLGGVSFGATQDECSLKICFDLFPLLNQEELLKGLEDVLKEYPKQTVKNILSSFVPERLAEALLDISGLSDKNSVGKPSAFNGAGKIANNMSRLEREIIVRTLKNIEVTPEGVLGFEQALVTKGGISLKEIDHKTMKSKIIDNLFFAGEIIDVDGKTGGFNLQSCWSTGYLAAQNTFGISLETKK